MCIPSFALVGPEVLWNSGYQGIVLLYLGPETIMPLASVIGVVVGFLLVFWRLLLKPFKKIAQFGSNKDSKPSTSDPSSAELQSDT